MHRFHTRSALWTILWVLGLAATANATTVEIRRVTSSPLEETHPRVSEPNVVFQKGSNVVLFDGSGSSKITNSPQADTEPWISGDRVIWKHDSEGSGCELWYRDLGSSAVLLDTELDCSSDIRIAGHSIVWTNLGENLADDVFLWTDPGPADQRGDSVVSEEQPRVGEVAGTPTAIWTGDGLTYFNGIDPPAQVVPGEVKGLEIDGRYAVWAASDGSDDEVWLFDGSALTRLTDNDFDDGDPQVANGNVVWVGNSGADSEIFWWDGATTTPLTDDDRDDSAPRISIGVDGVTIAWVSDDGDGEIFMYDGCGTTRLTTDSREDFDPSLDGNTVAWVKSNAESDDIYLATVTCDTVCGDGDPQGAEECDDGNVIGGDGCSATCTLEVCGNLVLDVGEECDDGNLVDDDGCDSSCLLECGNGGIDGAEECDDGNITAGDGCSPLCTIEVCGNGIVDFGEECDDGNLANGDGCNDTCQLEGPPSKAQQGCVNELNKRGVGVVKAQNKGSQACVKNANKGVVSKLGVPATAQDCLTNDVGGKVAKAIAGTVSKEAAKCDPAELPDFGYTDAGTVNTAATSQALGSIGDLFGADLDLAIIDEAADKAGAKCQQEVVKRSTAIADNLFKMTLKHTKKALAGKGVPQVFSSTGLQTSLLGELQGDPQGKAAKKRSQLSSGVAKRCAGVDIAAAFPGCAPADADELVTCAADSTECRFCQALNAFDALAIDCDDFDDGVANASCP